MTVFRFSDGSTRRLDLGTNVAVLGLDAEGYVVVRYTDPIPPRAGTDTEPFVMDYALTACCFASAKGCDGYIGCRACYAEVDEKLGGSPDPIAHTVITDPPKERPVSRNAAPKPADQYRAMGLTDESAWTPAMQLAVKQKWSGLEVDAKVDDLRTRLAAVAPVPVPSVADLVAQAFTQAEAEVERARLVRNGAVNAWREKGRLRAALEARELKFANLRAARGKPPVEAVVANAVDALATA